MAEEDNIEQALRRKLTDPRCTTEAVAAVFSALNSDAPLRDAGAAAALVRRPGLTDGDLEALAVFLIRQEEAGAETGCLLAPLFGELGRRGVAPTEAVRFAARLLAAGPDTALRSAALGFMRSAGPRNEFYAHWIVREFNQENYAAAVRRGVEPEAPPPPAGWREWEERGWSLAEADWPIAGLFFELKEADEKIDHWLHRVRSPLVPAWQTLEYFLLHRLWRAGTTTLARVLALGEMVRFTSGAAGLEELHDRALLVFRDHWRLLDMEYLTRAAAEVYLHLCDLQLQFAGKETAELPAPLDGLDVEYLEQRWRLGPERWESLAKALGG